MAGATSPSQPVWRFKHWSHCLKHHSFDGPGAPLARLPNALYQEGSSSLSRPITPPPATPCSPWHGRNRNRNAAKLASSRIRLRRWCWDNFLTLQHSKLVIFNQIVADQPLSLLSTPRKAPAPTFLREFLRLAQSQIPLSLAKLGHRGANGGGWSKTVISISAEPIMLGRCRPLWLGRTIHPTALCLFPRTEATLSARGSGLDLHSSTVPQ